MKSIKEAHILEKQLRRELQKINPHHPVLNYLYCSTWKAIEVYRKAINDLLKQGGIS